MAKEAETCHKYKIKQAENFTGITNGLLLAEATVDRKMKQSLFLCQVNAPFITICQARRHCQAFC